MIKFGTNGFKSIIAEDFNKENVQKIAYALVKVIKSEKSKKPIIIGYDNRFISNNASEWLMEVFTAYKITVKLYSSPIPTPMVFAGLNQDELDYGIIVTADNKGYEYNGIQVITRNSHETNKAFTKKIEKIINNNLKIKKLDLNKAKNKGLIQDYDNTKEYFKNISKVISKESKKNKLKVLFNPMHGTCSDYINTFDKLIKLNKLTVINNNIDPYFEKIATVPEKDNIEDFCKQVIKGKYSLGITVDINGTRLLVVDEKGNIYDNNELMALVYYYLVKYKENTGDIIKNCANTILLDKLAEKLGFNCFETRVGFKYTSQKIKTTNALVGGEMFGGICTRGFEPYNDCFLSIALILDAIITINKPLSTIIEEIKNFSDYNYSYYTSKIEVNNKTKIQKLLKKLTPKFTQKPTSIYVKDGIKYLFKDGSWAYLRFDDYEKTLRYYIEFTSKEETENNNNAILNYIQKYDKNSQK